VPELLLIAGTIAYRKGKIFKDTYNVCPILLNGNIIKKLYKSNDDGVYQVNGTFKTKNDGGKGVPVVTVGGITIGLDICMDFNIVLPISNGTL
jgi:predicted amidohydrolase